MTSTHFISAASNIKSPFLQEYDSMIWYKSLEMSEGDLKFADNLEFQVWVQATIKAILNADEK